MAKCAKCVKLVSKKTPGLQCGKCNKWYHAACVPITNEQLNILHSTDAVDWKCKACCGQYKQKRVSVIIPEPEDDEFTDTETPTTSKSKDPFTEEFMKNIRNEIRSVIKEEIQRTLAFYSNKIDDFQNDVDEFKQRVKSLENKQTDLQNKYSNLQLRYNSLEQKINATEQIQMENKIEICGVDKKDNENATDIVENIAKKILLDPRDVVDVYRKERLAPAAQKRISSSIIVTLKAGRRDSWLESAKANAIRGSDIGLQDVKQIYMREALTPATSFLLWKTKTELKSDQLYKFVWCKRGNVLIRENETAKIHTVRSTNDIDKFKVKTRT